MFDSIITSGLRVFFKLLYHPFSWAYDFVASAVSGGQWRSWVFATLPYLKGAKILELGFGPGHLQIALHKAGFQTYGLDASSQMAFQSFKRIILSSETPRLVIGYAQHIPFPTNFFDQVVATFPTDYIYQSITISEIFRTLKPGATLVILPAAWITGTALPYRFLRWLFRITRQSPPSGDPGFTTRYKQIFEKAGFGVQKYILELPHSKLLVISATKPDPSSKCAAIDLDEQISV